MPLIIAAPWLESAPRRSSALVELVDLLPTVTTTTDSAAHQLLHQLPVL